MLTISHILLRCALFGLALVACHNTQRDNPLDPQLTAAVELQVALDDTAGTAALGWTLYQGDTPFAEYQILRNIADRVTVDTLATFKDIDALSFTDTSLATGTTYAYRVAVRNSAGFAAGSTPVIVGPLQLPASAQLRAVFDSRNASAALVWSAYRGPRFSAYQVLRRGDDTERIVAELGSVEDTSFVDTNLHGAIDYIYQIVVRTERGETIAGETASGSIHTFVDEWSIDEVSLDRSSLGRLYSEGDEIRALVTARDEMALTPFSDRGPMHLVRYNREGLLLAHQRIATKELVVHDMAQSRDGRVWLLAGGVFFFDIFFDGSVGLMLADADGQLRMRSHDLFTADLAAPFEGDEATVLGRIGMGPLDQSLSGVATAILASNLSVTRDGETLYRDFTPETKALDTGWNLLFPLQQNRGADDEEMSIVESGQLWWNRIQRFNRLWLKEQTWNDFRLQVDVRFPIDSATGIEIGGDTFSRFTLGLLGGDVQQARLDWTYVAPDGSQTIEQRYAQPFPVLARAPYRLSLAAVAGQVRARIETPVLWAVRHTGQGRARLADLDGTMAIAFDQFAYSVNSEGAGELVGELAGPVASLRVWELDGRRFIGAILPETGQIVWGPIIGSSTRDWPNFLRRSFGPHLNPGGDALEQPTSFDVGPDGRFYVLDGANDRIVVFDTEGNYLTQWGQRGSSSGQFAFNTDGTPNMKIGGDIAVDDEGFVYVFDIRNSRIQKFAP